MALKGNDEHRHLSTYTSAFVNLRAEAQAYYEKNTPPAPARCGVPHSPTGPDFKQCKVKGLCMNCIEIKQHGHNDRKKRKW